MLHAAADALQGQVVPDANRPARPARPARSGAHAPNPALLAGCVRIYAGEVVIDIIKHAVLGKFNEIRWVWGGVDVVRGR